MPRSPQASRFAAPLSAIVLVAAVSGCSMFGEKDELYTPRAPRAGPLEVPPDLDRPARIARCRCRPLVARSTASAMNNAGGGSAAPIGFNASGDRDAIFAKVGEVLGATAGATVVSRAPILGTYDLDYMDAKFLVRVTKVGDGAYVSAVDPRGLPPTGEAPVKLVAALKAAIAP